MLELLIQGATAVLAGETQRLDVGVEEGRIVALEPEIAQPAKQVVKAQGLHLLPGLIDVHVHFNEPGQAHWEGIASGSAALAAGGGTLFVDMPLNSIPCTLDAVQFGRKLEAMQAQSHTDFALWGGLTPANLGELEALAACGVVGFKAFMSNSGLPEFPHADDATLYKGMQQAARLGLPVAVHAESDSLTQHLSQQSSGHTWREYVQSRPVFTELEAIGRALTLAQATGCKLHIVHISSGSGAVLAAEAKAQGVDVSLETCPHYLAFSEADLERLGAIGKCAPPLRSPAEVDKLWTQVAGGLIDLIASDHSPSPPEMKQGQNFFKLWGGISGVQSSLEFMLTEGFAQRGFSLPQIVALLSLHPAQRFGLSGKGQIALGYDADFCLVDFQQGYTLAASDLHYRHRQSPYLGYRFGARVQQTFVRGQPVFVQGHPQKPKDVRLIRPNAGQQTA